MKKISLLVLFVLVGCQFKLNQSNSEPSRDFMDAFKFDEHCLRICWLGINPGKTTTEEAIHILKASDQIDQQWHQVSDTGFITEWYPRQTKVFSSTVGIQFEKGVVKSLVITDIPYMMDDFLELLGQPDQIRIDVQVAEVDYVKYAVYFSESKTMIGVYPAKWTGPDPTDTKFTLWLNTDFNDAPPYNWGDIQPWLGYGHLGEYLPEVEIPKNP